MSCARQGCWGCWCSWQCALGLQRYLLSLPTALPIVCRLSVTLKYDSPAGGLARGCGYQPRCHAAAECKDCQDPPIRAMPNRAHHVHRPFGALTASLITLLLPPPLTLLPASLAPCLVSLDSSSQLEHALYG